MAPVGNPAVRNLMALNDLFSADVPLSNYSLTVRNLTDSSCKFSFIALLLSSGQYNVEFCQVKMSGSVSLICSLCCILSSAALHTSRCDFGHKCCRNSNWYADDGARWCGNNQV